MVGIGPAMVGIGPAMVGVGPLMVSLEAYEAAGRSTG